MSFIDKTTGKQLLFHFNKSLVWTLIPGFMPICMYCWNRNCRGFPLNNFRTCGVCVNDSNNQCWRKLNCVLTIPHYWITVCDEGNKINLRAVIQTSLGDDMILLQSELMHFLDVSSTEKFSGLIIKNFNFTRIEMGGNLRTSIFLQTMKHPLM